MEKTARATKRQQELLQYVGEFIHEHGYGPSYREIMRAIGYKSVSTVAVHIEGLITKGFLVRKNNSPRSLEIVSSSGSPTKNKAKSDIKAELETLFTSCNDAEDKRAVMRTAELLGFDALAQKLRATLQDDTPNEIES